jgi:hypothetical protein
MSPLRRRLAAAAAAFALAACGGSSNNNGNGDLGQACTMIEGLCVKPPATPTVAKRTACGEVTEFCDKTSRPAPNLGCLATPPTPSGGPTEVTLTGFVDVFSSGPNSSGVSISVYDAAQLLNGAAIGGVTPLAKLDNVDLDPATQRACDKEIKNGCSIPSRTQCTLPVCGDGLDGRPDNSKYCRANSDGSFSCNDRLRWEARYTMPVKLPTNKQLVVRVTGPNGAPDQTWANLITWNVYLSSAARSCAAPRANLEDNDCLDLSDAANPTFRLNVNALSKSDYTNIPVTAGLSSGIPAGRGAAAGEIHDCDNVRIEGAVVEVSPQPERSTYFNGNPNRTLPDSTRAVTDRLSLYAGLSLAPGKVKVVAAGLLTDGGPLTSLGAFEAWVYPDSVSVINVNGGKPRP